MDLVCALCGSRIETESDLAEGQHVLCPYCNGKFSYTLSSSQNKRNKIIHCPSCGSALASKQDLIGCVQSCQICGSTYVQYANGTVRPVHPAKVIGVDPGSHDGRTESFKTWLMFLFAAPLVCISQFKIRSTQPCGRREYWECLFFIAWSFWLSYFSFSAWEVPKELLSPHLTEAIVHQTLSLPIVVSGLMSLGCLAVCFSIFVRRLVDVRRSKWLAVIPSAFVCIFVFTNSDIVRIFCSIVLVILVAILGCIISKTDESGHGHVVMEQFWHVSKKRWWCICLWIFQLLILHSAIHNRSVRDEILLKISIRNVTEGANEEIYQWPK